jgi:hypothetical protein
MSRFTQKLSQNLKLEIAGGFLMQLVGDDMNNIVDILNTKYKKDVKVGKALDWDKYDEYDNYDYHDILKEKIPKKYLGTITPHYDEEQCSHWVYYDKEGMKWDSWNLGRQVPNNNQYCQTHALVLAFFPNMREVTDTINATKELVDFWEQNLLYILKRVNKKDLQNNIKNLLTTNEEETGKAQEYGMNVIAQISKFITNNKFAELTQFILNIVKTQRSIKSMAEWT